MLEQQRRVTSNFLLHDDEDAKFDREQIYVPLALVERRKPDKKEGGFSPEAGTKLYEPQYEEKQRFEHQAFLQQILEKGESKTKGRRIALIGEPGAGKTTTLQDIAFWVLKKNLSLPIWISLADLGQNENLIDFQTYLFENWLDRAITPSQKDVAQQELETHIQQGRVWLLLDGVDEVAASGVEILKHISQQLTGWFAQTRTVLTCRLNVWQADLNFLSDFETYRLLDFEYPQQVHQFINNWFDKQDISKAERLKTELDNPDKARLRDLIQNPLRLTLLCSSWQSNEANLPETKAQLYAQFVKQFYQWKYNHFPVSNRLQEILNQALGRLAIKDIDGSNSRFRLRESFISQELGYPDEEDSLFYLALKLGWLNCVGIAAESFTKDKVYAFFHPTFEEYFASCAIEDWDFFLPRDHVDKPVKGKEYRIFESQWKEVILLWLGQEDILDRKEKEQFISALVNFNDGCGKWNFHLLDRGFYDYRAYFLASLGIVEFQERCNLSSKIIYQIIEWGFGYQVELTNEKSKKNLIWINSMKPIQEYARKILLKTDHDLAVNNLIKFIKRHEIINFIKFSNQEQGSLLSILEILGRLCNNNHYFYNYFYELINDSLLTWNKQMAIFGLGNLAEFNKLDTFYTNQSINLFLNILNNTVDQGLMLQILKALKSIAQSKVFMNSFYKLKAQTIIECISKKIKNTVYQTVQVDASELILILDKNNKFALNILLNLIVDFKNNNEHNSRIEHIYAILSSQDKANLINSEILNNINISFLVATPQKFNHDHVYLQTAKDIFNLQENKLYNSKTVDKLVDLIDNHMEKESKDEHLNDSFKLLTILPEVLNILVEKDQVSQIIMKLKNNFLDSTPIENSIKFNSSYHVVWNSIKHLSYPEFYEAWHHSY